MADPAFESPQIAEPPPPADGGAAVSAWHPDHAWVWQVTALSIGLGILLALAIRTTERIRVSNDTTRLGVSTAFLSRYKEQNERLQQEMLDLRRQKDQFISGMNDDSRATEDRKRQFEELKASAGISAGMGPGVEITVRDNTGPLLPGDEPGNFALNLVHDQDLISLINELKMAGSTQIAIAGADAENLQRVIVTTTARCVGPTAIVNGIPLSAPYRIVALGDPAALRAALERPESYVRGRKLDERKMISIREEMELSVPEYSGTLNPRYARPIVKKDKAKPTG
ncbi:MAG: hypothetical protein K0Q72_5067 [Armatimonadetes bacterium]|jgi:uncharacterized protein YlxW (UPF0749 family)|nr:hypothetical protein [Armatimonadota bacterium]